MASKCATTIDREVATLIRSHRKTLQLSQSDIAKKLGLTFQQVQKYEKGTNRIGAGRLFELADIFNVPISELFPKAAGTPQRGQAQAQQLQRLTEFTNSADGWRLYQAFKKIGNTKARKALIALAEQLADEA
jgi:transcriptional regulator with XRE-family HTH domain